MADVVNQMLNQMASAVNQQSKHNVSKSWNAKRLAIFINFLHDGLTNPAV